MSTNGNPQELTTRQRRAIAALLAARDVKAAAELAHVGYRTILRWLDMPAFKAALLAAEGNALDGATRQLVALADSAIKVITWTMDNKEHPPAVRLRAAQAVLDYLLRLRELRNVEERLSALEEAVRDVKHK
jgi:hypothetical protein